MSPDSKQSLAFEQRKKLFHLKVIACLALNLIILYRTSNIQTFTRLFKTKYNQIINLEDNVMEMVLTILNHEIE